MKIRAIQIIHPDTKVDNVSLFQGRIAEIEKFVASTGIRYRYIAPKNHQIEAYFVQGIQQLPISVEEIDGIITVTQTPSKLVPSLSNYLQNKLPFRRDIQTFDLTSGCSGYTEALTLANQLLQLSPEKKIIICNGDFSNHIIDENNLTVSPLFSDIAAITLVESDAKSLFYSNHFSYGDGYQAINSKEGCMTMNGLEVFQYSTQYVANSILEMIEQTKLSLENIDVAFFHQANQIINQTIIRQLKLDPEKVPFSIQAYGNSSSASIPLTMAMQGLPSERKSLILLSGFGVGFRICNCLMETINFETNITAFEE